MPPPRVALATCRDLPALDAENAVLLPLLRERGVEPVAAVWDGPAVDWESFALVHVRTTWDYARRPAAFLAWLRSLPRVLNPLPALLWNADKGYLQNLLEAGVPIVPTAFVAPGETPTLPIGPFVVKPAVGAGSKDAGRFDSHTLAEARELIARIHATGRVALVQPYLSRIDAEGEADLVFLAGRYSHAVRKGALLAGRPRVENVLFVEEELSPYTPTADEIALAEAALTLVPGGPASLVCARVDLAPADGGGRAVMEVEVIEPSLFFPFAPGSAERLAEALASAALSG